VHEIRGIAYCLNAATGETVYEERLTPRPRLIYSSATCADGKLYCLSQDAGTYVIAAQPDFELLAHNELDEARANASMVVSNGQLLLRNDRFLYCIGTD
jgi:outer membrane protein assembly factor BamB